MLVAAAVPIAVAHNDTGRPGSAGSAPSQGVTNGPEVFGTYVGTGGVVVVGPFVGTNSRLCGATCGGGSGGGGGSGPVSDSLVTIVTTTCDQEVQSAGSPQVTEATVDGNTKSGTTAVPDGMWDDGGRGGACHTQGQYGNNWDSPGCSDLNNNGNNDLVGGQDAAIPTDEHNAADTFVLASCDDETRNTVGLAACLANSVLGDRPEDIVNECPDRVDPGTPDLGSFIECGSDGSGDQVTSGYVDNDASKAKSNGLNTFPAPTIGSNCQESDAALVLFVLAGVDIVNGNSLGNVKVSAPTTGWVGTLNK